MATWAKGIDFKNSKDTIRIGGIGIYGTDTSSEKIYIGLGSEPWSNAGLQLTSSNINFKGNKIYHAGDKPTPADIGAATASHSHNYLPLSGGKLTGNVELTKSVANAETNYVATRSDTGYSVWLGIGEGGVNHGVYSRTLNKWIVYADDSSIYLNGNASTATKLKTARTITIGNTGKSFNGSGNVSWSLSEIGAAASSHTHSYLPLNGGLMTGKISSSFATNTYLAGNQGNALISSTTGAGAYVMLHRYPSLNGYFTMGGYQGKYLLQYTAKSTVTAGTNSVTKSLTLLDESGNASFPGTISASGNIQSSSYFSAPTLVGDRIQGRSAANKFYAGSGTCRIDTDSNYFRIFTSKVGSNDYGLRINPAGGMSIMVNSVGKHEFNASGTKTGGTIEIEGITYGMSPIDSPKFLLEDILFDIDVEENGTIIELNNIFAKSVNGKYAVFINNNKAEVSDKQFDNFKVSGYTGKVDIRIVGKRIGYENEYFKIMGGFEHGIEQEISN